MHIHVCDQWTVTQLHIPFKCVCESERGMCTEVENGLRQGCTLAPTLFNLYACLVMER